MATAKIQQHILLGKLKGNRLAFILLFGMQNATASLKVSLAIPYKAKHTLTI